MESSSLDLKKKLRPVLKDTIKSLSCIPFGLQPPLLGPADSNGRGSVTKKAQIQPKQVKRSTVNVGPMKFKEVREDSTYRVRHNFDEDGAIHCLAFTVPLFDFDLPADYSHDTDEFGPNAGAKQNWKHMCEVVLDKSTQIPLKQMCLKAKHEELIYQRILQKFTYGKPITEERFMLANLNENMRFTGGPKDKTYIKKVMHEGVLTEKDEKMAQIRARLKKKGFDVSLNMMLQKTLQSKIIKVVKKSDFQADLQTMAKKGFHTKDAKPNKSNMDLAGVVALAANTQSRKTFMIETDAATSVHSPGFGKQATNRSLYGLKFQQTLNKLSEEDQSGSETPDLVTSVESDELEVIQETPIGEVQGSNTEISQKEGSSKQTASEKNNQRKLINKKEPRKMHQRLKKLRSNITNGSRVFGVSVQKTMRAIKKDIDIQKARTKSRYSSSAVHSPCQTLSRDSSRNSGKGMQMSSSRLDSEPGSARQIKTRKSITLRPSGFFSQSPPLRQTENSSPGQSGDFKRMRQLKIREQYLLRQNSITKTMQKRFTLQRTKRTVSRLTTHGIDVHPSQTLADDDEAGEQNESDSNKITTDSDFDDAVAKALHPQEHETCSKDSLHTVESVDSQNSTPRNQLGDHQVIHEETSDCDKSPFVRETPLRVGFENLHEEVAAKLSSATDLPPPRTAASFKQSATLSTYAQKQNSQDNFSMLLAGIPAATSNIQRQTTEQRPTKKQTSDKLSEIDVDDVRLPSPKQLKSEQVELETAGRTEPTMDQTASLMTKITGLRRTSYKDAKVAMKIKLSEESDRERISEVSSSSFRTSEGMSEEPKKKKMTKKQTGIDSLASPNTQKFSLNHQRILSLRKSFESKLTVSQRSSDSSMEESKISVQETNLNQLQPPKKDKGTKRMTAFKSQTRRISAINVGPQAAKMLFPPPERIESGSTDKRSEGERYLYQIEQKILQKISKMDSGYKIQVTNRMLGSKMRNPGFIRTASRASKSSSLRKQATQRKTISPLIRRDLKLKKGDLSTSPSIQGSETFVTKADGSADGQSKQLAISRGRAAAEALKQIKVDNVQHLSLFDTQFKKATSGRQTPVIRKPPTNQDYITKRLMQTHKLKMPSLQYVKSPPEDSARNEETDTASRARPQLDFVSQTLNDSIDQLSPLAIPRPTPDLFSTHQSSREQCMTPSNHCLTVSPRSPDSRQGIKKMTLSVDWANLRDRLASKQPPPSVKTNSARPHILEVKDCRNVVSPSGSALASRPPARTIAISALESDKETTRKMQELNRERMLCKTSLERQLWRKLNRVTMNKSELLNRMTLNQNQLTKKPQAV